MRNVSPLFPSFEEALTYLADHGECVLLWGRSMTAHNVEIVRSWAVIDRPYRKRIRHGQSSMLMPSKEGIKDHFKITANV